MLSRVWKRVWEAARCRFQGGVPLMALKRLRAGVQEYVGSRESTVDGFIVGRYIG
jgi:hypothetical protein